MPDHGRCDAPVPLEWLATGCLVAAIVGGPIALGGTPTFARLGLEAAMAAACVFWLVAGTRPVGLTATPLVVAAAACLQIVPLPGALLEWLSPLAAAAWHTAAASGFSTISVDPGATATGIRRLLLGLATVAVVAELGRRPALRRWLIGALSAAAVTTWALGILFPVDPAARILLGFIDLKGPLQYWQTEIEEPVGTAGIGLYETVNAGGVRHEMPAWSIGDGFGSYVVSNHFAGAICLTVPIAIVAWLVATRGRLPATPRHAAAAITLAAAVWTVGGLAGSRAGAASTLLAGLALFTLVAETPAWRRIASFTLVGYAAVLLGFCILFFGPWTGVVKLLPENVQLPLRSLRSDGRVVATRVAGQILLESPILGSGLDTFGELQPRYLGNVFHLHFAHNDYAQLLAETGLVGGGIAVLLGGLVIGAFRRFRRREPSPDRSLDAGPWAALAGFTLHSAFDWNMHVPANAMLAAVVAGLAVATAPAAATHGSLDIPRYRRFAAWALAIACAVSLIGLARDAGSAVARRQLASAIVAARRNETGSPNEAVDSLDAAIAAGERTARWDPLDARLAVLLGQAHLHRAAVTPGNELPGEAASAAEAWFARARRASPVCRGCVERESF